MPDPSLGACCSWASHTGVAAQVTAWLDEEWAPLPVHAELGRATAAGYSRLRAAGGRDVTDVLLGLSAELMPFNFKETFTGPFEVGGTGRAVQGETCIWKVLYSITAYKSLADQHTGGIHPWVLYHTAHFTVKFEHPTTDIYLSPYRY